MFKQLVLLHLVMFCEVSLVGNETYLESEISDRSYRSHCQCFGRSYPKPQTAREVKLEDIDIIGAIGDSDTAAFAANSGGLLDYFTEYWGTSFATGTDGNAHTNPSLANLLRRCNPGLIGGSRGQDSAIFDTGQNLHNSM